MRVVMLAYGTWGDVRPYVVLGQALQREGFDIVMLAAEKFREWVEARDLEFVGLSVNVQKVLDSMMNASGNEGTGTNFIASALRLRKFVSSAMDLLGNSVLDVAREGDALLYVEAAHGVLHGIIDKYHLHPIIISLFPTVPTAQFPVFNLPPLPSWMPAQGTYNKLSGWVLRYAMWQIIGRQGNKIRTEQLGLSRRNWRKHRASLTATPQVMLMSRHVIPPPPDWSQNIHVTGYLFDDDPEWDAPADLLAFLANGEKPVYIGLGSMVQKDAAETTRLFVDALQQAGKRAIFLTGFAGIGQTDLPESIFLLKYAPHSWLFPRMAAVIHHGGAGTTAAGLRAGVPSIIVPTLGDQPFWGRRIHALGAGTKPIMRGKLTADKLAVAIREATENRSLCERAQELSQLIQAEDGLGEAVTTVKQLLDASAS